MELTTTTHLLALVTLLFKEKMAYFAELDQNNVVLRVLVVADSDVQNLSFPDSEAVGITFLHSLPLEGIWKQTTHDNTFRFRCAVVGGAFHPECGEYGGFADPKPADNFIWDSVTCSWIPPVPYPTDGYAYYWDLIAEKWKPALQDAPQTTFIG